MARSLFSNNLVRLTLKSVTGPGDFILYMLDSFGTPVVTWNSRDGMGANDTITLTAGDHTHVNWVLIASGKYHIGLQASGVLAATGDTTTSEVAEYRFAVGELPKLSLTKEAGHDYLLLEWQSETNGAYQIQYRKEAGSDGWTDWELRSWAREAQWRHTSNQNTRVNSSVCS